MKKVFIWVPILVIIALVLGSCCSNNEKPANVVTSENQQMIIAATVKIKADKVSTFIEATKDLIAQSRAEEGNISYTLYQSPTDSCSFIFFEEWKSQEAISFHFETPHFKGFGPISEECNEEPAKIKIYQANPVN